MDFLERYLKKENGIKYDIDYMITEKGRLASIVSRMPAARNYGGINNVGMIIASHAAEINRDSYFMIHHGEIKGKIHEGNIILIDGVTTTGTSLKKALEVMEAHRINRDRIECFAVVDGRLPGSRDFSVKSLYDLFANNKNGNK